MRKLLYSILALIYICNLINSNLNNENTKEIFEVKFGEIKEIEISGKLFTIKVKGNATTGYFTFIKNFNHVAETQKAVEFFDLEFDKTVNLYRSKDYEITHPGIDGGDGYFVYKIKALKPLDEVKIEFLTIKPWEVNNKNAKFYITTVTVWSKDLFYLE